jgi:hypothetical protein
LRVASNLDELRCWSGNKQTSLVGAVMAME